MSFPNQYTFHINMSFLHQYTFHITHISQQMFLSLMDPKSFTTLGLITSRLDYCNNNIGEYTDSS